MIDGRGGFSQNNLSAFSLLLVADVLHRYIGCAIQTQALVVVIVETLVPRPRIIVTFILLVPVLQHQEVPLTIPLKFSQ